MTSAITDHPNGLEEEAQAYLVTGEVCLLVDAESHAGASGGAAALISDAIAAALAGDPLTERRRVVLAALREVVIVGSEQLP